MKTKLIPVRFGLLLILILAVSSCSRVQPVAEDKYSEAIVGQWLGSVEGMEESITFSSDASFNAQLRPRGFISNTLSEGVTGTISGTWPISQWTVTLNINVHPR